MSIHEQGFHWKCDRILFVHLHWRAVFALAVGPPQLT